MKNFKLLGYFVLIIAVSTELSTHIRSPYKYTCQSILVVLNDMAIKSSSMTHTQKCKEHVLGHILEQPLTI